ncbi:hypothetical protein FKM82_022736 [Ascaphus truei]
MLKGKTGRFICSICWLHTERYHKSPLASHPSSFYMAAGSGDRLTYSVKDGKGRLLLLLMLPCFSMSVCSGSHGPVRNAHGVSTG